MLKAYFLKEDPLWFAFWGLLTAAERGASARCRHLEGRNGNNQAGVAARRQAAGVNMVGAKATPLFTAASLYCVQPPTSWWLPMTQRPTIGFYYCFGMQYHKQEIRDNRHSEDHTAESGRTH